LPRGANEYLFGALGQWPTLRVVAVQRRVMVSVASVAILGIGLLLIHVPRLRSPGALLSVAVILGAGAMIAPQAAPVALQGALVGLGVAIAAATYAWLTTKRMTFVAPLVKS